MSNVSGYGSNNYNNYQFGGVKSGSMQGTPGSTSTEETNTHPASMPGGNDSKDTVTYTPRAAKLPKAAGETGIPGASGTNNYTDYDDVYYPRHSYGASGYYNWDDGIINPSGYDFENGNQFVEGSVYPSGIESNIQSWLEHAEPFGYGSGKMYQTNDFKVYFNSDGTIDYMDKHSGGITRFNPR